MQRYFVLFLMLSGCVWLTGCRGASKQSTMTGHHDTFERLESYPLPPGPGPQQVSTGRRPSPEDPFIQAQMQQPPTPLPVPRTPPKEEGVFRF